MLARLFIGLYFAVEIHHFNRPQLAHESHISSFHKILKTISRTGLFIKSRRNRSKIKMFLVVWDDMHSLTSKELEFISKNVLRELENCIENRLIEHVRADLEVRRYRRCLKHHSITIYRVIKSTHIDDSTLLIKNCSEYHRKAC